MSLTIPPQILAEMENREIDQNEFATIIKDSLPKAWQIIEQLVVKLKSSTADLECYGTDPMEEETRGQLLRMLAGNALRETVERHFGVHLAFQNCHNVAVVKEGKQDSKEVKDFKSIKSQLKGQKPQYQHC